MVLGIILSAGCVIGVATIATAAYKYLKKETLEKMSFKESLDLVGLPIVTFYNNDKKLNFLLDTGSDLSHLNSRVLKYLKYTPVNSKTTIIGIGGNNDSSCCCNLDVNYKKFTFNENFYVSDMSASFDQVKQETGVTIHGILGSRFFTKYKYIFDFDNLVAYSKGKK